MPVPFISVSHVRSYAFSCVILFYAFYAFSVRSYLFVYGCQCLLCVSILFPVFVSVFNTVVCFLCVSCTYVCVFYVILICRSVVHDSEARRFLRRLNDTFLSDQGVTHTVDKGLPARFDDVLRHTYGTPGIFTIR